MAGKTHPHTGNKQKVVPSWRANTIQPRWRRGRPGNPASARLAHRDRTKALQIILASSRMVMHDGVDMHPKSTQPPGYAGVCYALGDMIVHHQGEIEVEVANFPALWKAPDRSVFLTTRSSLRSDDLDQGLALTLKIPRTA